MTIIIILLQYVAPSLILRSNIERWKELVDSAEKEESTAGAEEQIDSEDKTNIMPNRE